MAAVERIRDHQTEHGVAEELQPLVRGQAAVLVGVRAVRERAHEQLRRPQAIPSAASSSSAGSGSGTGARDNQSASGSPRPRRSAATRSATIQSGRASRRRSGWRSPLRPATAPRSISTISISASESTSRSLHQPGLRLQLAGRHREHHGDGLARHVEQFLTGRPSVMPPSMTGAAAAGTPAFDQTGHGGRQPRQQAFPDGVSGRADARGDRRRATTAPWPTTTTPFTPSSTAPP